MRKVIAFFMVVSLLGLGLTYRAEAAGKSPDASSLKIGSVDMGKVIGQYYKAKEVEETLQKKQEAKQKEIEGKREEINKLTEELKAQGSVLKAEEKKKKAKIIEEKKKMLGQLFRTYDSEMRSNVIQKQKEIIKDIQTAIKAFGKKNGYTLILDARQVLYSSKANLDITGAVIKLLNKTKKTSN